MSRAWVKAERLMRFVGFGLVWAICMSSRAIAADDAAQAVPLIEMPAKVVERIEAAIRSYPSRGRDPDNFRQRQARTNASQALGKLRRLRWPDYSTLELVKIDDLNAVCPSRQGIKVAWIAPAKDESFRLLTEANELVPLPAQRYRIEPFPFERFWKAEREQLLQEYNVDSEPIGWATLHPKGGLMTRSHYDALRVVNFVYLAAMFEKTKELTLLVDRELDAGAWGNEGPFLSAWNNWHSLRVAHGNRLLATGASLAEVLSDWRETERLFEDPTLRPLIQRLERQIAEDRDTNNLDADELAKLTPNEQVRYWIARWPQDRGSRIDELIVPRDPAQPAATALQKLGWHAVPQLIAALRDTRLSRKLYSDSWDSPAQVVHVQDLAVLILRRLIEEEPLFRSEGLLFSSQTSQAQSDVIAKFEAWWNEYGQDSERAWWLSRLELRNYGPRIRALTALEQLDPQAVNSVAKLQAWVESAQPQELVPYCDHLRQRGFTRPIPRLDEWLNAHRQNGYQNATSSVLLRHGHMPDFRFLQQCLRMKVPTQFTSDFRTRIWFDLTQNLLGQWYAERLDFPKMIPSAIPLFVDVLDRDRLVGLPGRQHHNSITEFELSESALLILQELTGHKVEWDRTAALAERKAAMDRWLAWWHESGRADYLRKHPEVAPLFEEAWRKGETVDLAKLPELVDAEDPREFCRITYRIPRDSVAKLVAEGSLLVNTVPEFADRFRFTTPVAAEKWFRGESVVSGQPLPCVIVPIADNLEADSKGRIWCRWDLFGFPPALFENGVWTTFAEQRLPNSWTWQTFPGNTGETTTWETIERLRAGNDGAMFFPNSFNTQCGQKSELSFDLVDAQGWLRFSVAELPQHPSFDRILSATPRGQIKLSDHIHFTRDDAGRIFVAERDSKIIEKGREIPPSARLRDQRVSSYTRHGLIGNGDVWLAGRHDFLPLPFGVDQFVALVVEQGEIVEKPLPLSPEIGPPVVWVNAGPIDSSDPARSRDRSVTAFDSNGNVVTRQAGHLIGVDRRGGRWLALGPRGAIESVQRFDATGGKQTWKNPTLRVPDIWSASLLDSAFAPDDTVWLPNGKELIHLRFGEEAIELIDRFPLPEEGWHRFQCDPSGDVWMVFQDHKGTDKRPRLYRFATHSRSRDKQ